MDLIRRVYFLAARGNFHVRIDYLEGSKNEVADALSRFQMDRFFALAANAQQEPTVLDTDLLELQPGLLKSARLTIRGELLRASSSQSTKRTCATGFRRFVDFCSMFSLRPISASSETLSRFLAFLFHSNLPIKTAEIYLAAVKEKHVPMNLSLDFFD